MGDLWERMYGGCDTMHLCRVRERVEALQVLADGCPKHPSYRAKRKPDATLKPDGEHPRLEPVPCPWCNRMWEARQKLEGDA